MLRAKVARELADARRGSGLSMQSVARAVGVSVDTVRRLERGEPGACTFGLIARVAEAVGLQLAASLHPNGDPVRDQGHLALLNRLRARLGPAARLRTEVPVPIAGDLRSGDAVLMVRSEKGSAGVLLEAETHLDDIQLVERRASAKQRDLAAARLVLVVADTRHNRKVIERHPELRERFPIPARPCLAALSRGNDPGGDALVLL